MIGYAEREIFTRKDLTLLRRAQHIVDHVPYNEPHLKTMGFSSRVVRCHELARVVARLLGDGVEVQDGKYTLVDHTWLWIRHPEGQFIPPGRGIRKILDVYVPGGLPQVQLVDTSQCLEITKRYRWSYDYDVREDIVELLLRQTIRNIAENVKETTTDDPEDDFAWMYGIIHALE